MPKIDFFIPVIYEWNYKNTKGETTKYATLIALEYYKYSIDNDKYFTRSDMKEKVIKTILCGSHEIKKELETIFDSIFINKWKHHNDPYYELSKAILVDSSSNFNAVSLIQLLPEYILKLFDLFLVYTPTEGSFSHYRSDIDIEKYFNLESNHFDYYPVSSFQTPIYFLLKVAYKITIDFLLDFVNRATEYYAYTDFDKSVKKVESNVHNHVVVQWLSHCLWNMYRGNSSPVSPNALQSIHMALEKYLLEIGKNIDKNDLEQALFYLLEQSKSSSITAVVTSIVLAYPDKTFNVATVLFKTKEFIMQDTIRCINENQLEMLYRIGYGLNGEHKIHVDERLETVKEKHRNSSLEQQFLSYLLEKYDTDTDESINARRVTLFAILDNYYKELETISSKTANDKIWRMSLARMDTRKMTATVSNTDKGQIVQLKANLEPELEEYSKNEIEKNTQWMGFLSLKLWSTSAYEKRGKAKEYTQYENNPEQILNDLKKVIENLKKSKPLQKLTLTPSNDERTYLTYLSTPAYVSAVLIRDYFEKLNITDKDLCKNIILEITKYPLKDYNYQIGDGVQQAISVLPQLAKNYTELQGYIKKLLLLLLLKDFRLGGMSMDYFSIFPIEAINRLAEFNYDGALSILIGYLTVKQKFRIEKEAMRKKSYKTRQYISNSELLTKFINDNSYILEAVENDSVIFDKSYINYDTHTLLTVFKLIPPESKNEVHRKILNCIFEEFSKKLMLSINNNTEYFDYTERYIFLKTFSSFLLRSDNNSIKEIITYFTDHFSVSEGYAELFKQLIIAEDEIRSIDKFWLIWELFQDSIIKICNNNSYIRDTKQIVESYLFAQTPWGQNTKEWHTIREKDRGFFKAIVDNIGHIPSTLYAISKLLNDVGGIYIDEGLDWLDTILSPNNSEKLLNSDSNETTIFFMENYIRRYIYLNNDKIKKTIIIKNKVIVILNFLIDNGSVIGYILRERIL